MQHRPNRLIFDLIQRKRENEAEHLGLTGLGGEITQLDDIYHVLLVLDAGGARLALLERSLTRSGNPGAFPTCGFEEGKAHRRDPACDQIRVRCQRPARKRQNSAAALVH